MKKNETMTYRVTSALWPATRLVVLLFVGVLLTACSDDAENEKILVTLELMPGTQSFLEVEPIAASRNTCTRGDTPTPAFPAWTPPTGFYTYDQLNDKFTNQTNLVNRTIGIFFTQNGVEPSEDRFLYNANSSTSKWRTTKDLETGSYYLYGFMPSGSGIKASISSTQTPGDNSKYEDGAVLTLDNMPTVTASDVCVVVGAKAGNSESDDNDLSLGQFKYDASKTGEGATGHNYVFLLFDHIYSSLRFTMQVDSEYDKLRTIVLKKLTLRVNESSGAKTRVKVVIKLAKKTDGITSPIENIQYTFDNNNTDEEPEPIFKSNTGLTLTTTASEFMGSFVPKDISSFTLESTYDVYDKHDHLIRTNCTAKNKLNIDKLFFPLETLVRGKMFTINLTIEPTYLYVLADPDLDNPTVKIED